MEIEILLKERLKERKISQREFARISGVRRPTINEMCNNQIKQLPLENLAAICETLECEITDILKLVKSPIKWERGLFNW